MRFPGFEGEWEAKKLGEISTFYSGGTPLTSKREYFDGDIPFIRSGEINSDKTEQFISELGLKNSSAKLVEVGDILYALYGATSGEVGICKLNGAINQAVLCIKSNENHYFLFSYLRDKKESITNTFLQGGQGNLSADIVKKIELYIPSIKEQTKISSFLSKIDERIQTQNKIINDLRTLKSATAKKIFSQELRFKDDNGNDYPNWEILKLQDICEIIGGGTPETNKAEYWNGHIQWFTPTEIKSNFVSKSERTISELGLKNSSAKLLPKGTILLTTRATIGEVSITLEECTTNQGFQSLIVKENYNNIFLFNWLKISKYELEKRANGSTFPEISKSEIEKIDINIPCLEEQAKIANFLSFIDSKIDVETQIMNKLGEQKKFLLQQMFV